MPRRMWFSSQEASCCCHRLNSIHNLEYLGIGCWSLQDNGPAMPLLHATLEIHFLEAPNSLLEQLRSTQDVQLTATVNPDWKHYHLLKSGSTQQNLMDPFPLLEGIAERSLRDYSFRHANELYDYYFDTLVFSLCQ